MEFSARQIATLVDGRIEGNPDVIVNKLSKIEEGVPASLSFLSNPQYTPYIYTTDASIVIVNEDFKPEKSIKEGCTLIRVRDARESFARLLEAYNEVKLNKSGIEQPSFIADSAQLGENIYVGAFVYIGENVKIGNNVKIFPNTFIGDNSVIGDNSLIYAGVKIYSESQIGSDCTLHAGVVIGADGFGFSPNSENNYQKIVQIGNVVIEDHVEIGANTTVDRATLGSTFIRKGVKLDNLIQVGHNVDIGQNTVIAAQSGIAGSAKMGKDCMVGGQAGIVGHVTIADGVKIAAQSGVGANITKEGEIVQGSPSFYIGDYKKAYVYFRKLPELNDKISELEKEIADLRKCLKETNS